MPNYVHREYLCVIMPFINSFYFDIFNNSIAKSDDWILLTPEVNSKKLKQINAYAQSKPL